MTTTLRIGTRKSPLAMWQAEHVKAELEKAHAGLDGGGLQVELVGIETKGDKILDVALAKVGGKGLFVKELEVALLQGDVDLCVHSTKDMPADLPEGLGLVAFPPRADPRDALVAPPGKLHEGGLRAIPRGARVGTSSLRRQAQIKLARPDVEIVSVRGNIQTRMKKVDELGLACVVLASAGLDRMGLEQNVRHRFHEDEMLPAAGQGILAIEARTLASSSSSSRASSPRGEGAPDDATVLDLLRVLDDPSARTAVVAERAFLKMLGGGCQVPIGAYATQHGSTLTLRGLVAMPDGSVVVRAVMDGPADDPRGLGERLGAHVLARGGRKILVDLQLSPGDGAGGDASVDVAHGGLGGAHEADVALHATGALAGARVIVARDDAPDDRVSLALAAHGADVVPLRLMRFDEPADAAPLERAVRSLGGYDVVAFTSANAVERFFDRLVAAGVDLRALKADALVAAVGRATADALRERGVVVDVEGDGGGAALAQHVQAATDLKGKRVLLPRAADGREEFVDAATAAGATVDVVDAYRQVPRDDVKAAIEAAFAKEPTAIVLTSPRRVELLAGARFTAKTIAIGPTTAAAMQAAGMRVDVALDKPTPAAVVAAVRGFA